MATIDLVTGSAIATEYAEGLDSGRLESFTHLTEALSLIGDALGKALASSLAFLDWKFFRETVEKLQGQFPGYAADALRKLQFHLVFAESLVDSGADLEAEVVDESDFTLRSLSTKLPQKWFSCIRPTSFRDSIAAFSCDDPAGLQLELKSAPCSPVLLHHLLLALRIAPVLPVGHVLLVRSDSDAGELAAIESMAHMIILATGRPIHVPRKYSRPPQVIDPDSIKIGHPYHQWADTIGVLSEYNSRDDLLLKYLTLYHVIENFMVKHQIVELERRHNGRMFSIRDFRRLYKAVETPESSALTRFLVAVLPLPLQAGATLRSEAEARWQVLLSMVTEQEIDHALQLLDLQTSSQDFAKKFVSNFVALVYAMRCAIVHNKETELHLTYADLSGAMVSLLEEFLLPVLEGLSFFLISKPNNSVWYVNKSLTLYGQTP
jgi:hypothetical protein